MNSRYKIRSKTLHGEDLESGVDTLRAVRNMTAAVIKAVVEWRQYQHRIVDEGNRGRFLAEIESASISGKSLVGVTAELARFLRKQAAD